MKSVFDGWEKKIEGALRDHNGGFCALGWIIEVMDLDSQEYHATFNRLNLWCITNLGYDLVACNNRKILDIEGFKMADLLSQGYCPSLEEADTAWDSSLGLADAK